MLGPAAGVKALGARADFYTSRGTRTVDIKFQAGAVFDTHKAGRSGI